jgi:hypothetical protein
VTPTAETEGAAQLLPDRRLAPEERPHLGPEFVDLPLLSLQLVQEHRREDVVADTSGLAVLVEHHQLGIDLGNLLGDQRPYSGEPPSGWLRYRKLTGRSWCRARLWSPRS